jgi:hypothetical protein
MLDAVPFSGAGPQMGTVTARPVSPAKRCNSRFQRRPWRRPRALASPQTRQRGQPTRLCITLPGCCRESRDSRCSESHGPSRHAGRCPNAARRRNPSEPSPTAWRRRWLFGLFRRTANAWMPSSAPARLERKRDTKMIFRGVEAVLGVHPLQDPGIERYRSEIIAGIGSEEDLL